MAEKEPFLHRNERKRLESDRLHTSKSENQIVKRERTDTAILLDPFQETRYISGNPNQGKEKKRIKTLIAADQTEKREGKTQSFDPIQENRIG